ncbi:Fur family transcriptional regulator [Sulfuricurvum sp.]|uniref:Fur family transcriptional regulator n=1 Tax=Sulfuricurvum sp. TaxID=2025608 RepID=UPI0035630971
MNYQNLLQKYQLKATPQRMAIIALMQRAGHISIDELFYLIREIFASISLATLYKNIHTMMEVSLIREVKVPGMKSKYEIEKQPHAHALCKRCGELIDIPFDSIQLLKNTIQESNYIADEVSIVISGICPKCQK